MNKPLRISLMLSIMILFVYFCKIAEASLPVCTSSNGLGKLVADVDTLGRDPSAPGRIPLILIHGLHGTDSTTFSNINGSTSEEKEYFQNFINYFYSSELKDRFQLFRFHYLSDQPEGFVTNIAEGLQECLDDFISNHTIKDDRIVIIAHSMGGLVARSYMQEHKHAIGSYANQYGGERVEKLITLATPHHGSPGANKCCRDLLATDPAWAIVIDISDTFIWGLYFGLVPNQPNRSDLRWDNWDGTMTSVGYDLSCAYLDKNGWLISLNSLIEYDGKIIAYAGYIDPNNPLRMSLVSDGPSVIVDYIIEQADDAGEKAICASIALNEGLMGLYGNNDGLVPFSSARFVGHNTIQRNENFIGFDHGEMKGDRLIPGDGKYELLFNSIRQDLETTFIEANVATIASAEYFIDNDPGEGNGTPVPAKDGSFDTTIENIEVTMPTSNLSIGVHNLYVRMKNSEGIWGTPRKIMFEVTGDLNIAGAEYYIDTDPGGGNGTPIPASDGAYDEDIEPGTVAINTSNLSFGLHNIYVRSKNSEGHWGTPRQYKFEVLQSPIMAAAEYYVDTDPGIEMGTPLNAKDGIFSDPIEHLSGILNTTSLTFGTHELYVRAMDSYGRWGEAQGTVFTVFPFDPTPPLSTITLPKNGETLFSTTFTIKGTANDGVGSGVKKVEISTDGGSTWNLASGITSWSYLWTIPGDGTYNIKSRATDNANNVESPGAGIIVTVVQRQPSNVSINGRQLLINGSPFTIKGVGYSPVPIGDDPETMPPYGDYFTSDQSGIYDRDLPLLRDIGANTIRLWGWNNTADHLDFLDKAYNNGINPIYVIAGFWINSGLDIDPDSPANVREQLETDFREMVSIHKNHPAILMWAIGNELNASWMYGNKLDDLFSLINEMSAEAHAEEGSNYHPVTTPLVDVDLINTIETYDTSVPSLDIWGADVYRGNTFGTLFDDYEAVSQKPFVILEYGIDAYDNINGDEYENIGIPYQADYAEDLWNEIEDNSDVCAGGTIMAYSDEWWKGKNGTGTGCPDNNPAYHSTCGYPSSSHPDGYSNEEWWGIIRTIDNGNNPDVMKPRAVYYKLKSLWSPFLILGDINKDGVVDISDVILVLRIALVIDPQVSCSDINDDGIVDISDVILTLRMALGIDPLKQCVG